VDPGGIGGIDGIGGTGDIGGLGSDDFVEIYRLHYPRLVRALTLAGATAAAAEDAAQEAFARSLRHWARIRRGPCPAGYPYRVGFRLLRDPNDVRAARAIVTDGTEIAPDRPDETAILSQTVEATLAGLPPRPRQCAVCCFVLGFTPVETARLLGIQPATVRKHLESARAAFGAVLRA
jgi:RNA polymerase sigma-70 factor (ECF subfamily)